MELLQTLTSQLGITDEQAKGGTGLLFKMAKEKLAGDEFSQVAKAVPGVEGLISAAPKSGGIAGGIGGMASGLGGSVGKLGAMASLAGGFKNLNLDSGVVGKFVPIVLSYMQSKGGDAVKGMLEKAIK